MLMDCTSPVLGIYPCGKCLNCRARSRQEWVFRIRQELESSNFGLFVTLTYDDEKLPPGGVSVRDVQLFLKRLRKHFDSKVLRYFLVSEYGDHTFRPHYHGILFFSIDRNNDIYDIITESWQNGFCQFGEVEEGSIVYCTKYCLKGSEVPEGKQSNFRLVSKMNGGVGCQYISLQSEYHSDLSKPSLVRWHGECSPMPRYYREKMLGKLSESDKIDIRLAYQEYLRLQRERLHEKELKKFYLQHNRDYADIELFPNCPPWHADEVLNDFYKWKADCNDRKAELFYKHTKKQNLL